MNNTICRYYRADMNIDEIDIHEECRYQCRSSIILRYIDQHPESLAKADKNSCLLLHWLLLHETSSIDLTLTVIEKYPAALKHRFVCGILPIQIEAFHRCRYLIMSKCLELYPESLDEATLRWFMYKVNNSRNFDQFKDVLLLVFAAFPMGLYSRENDMRQDVRDDLNFRRKILNLLPRHVFTPIHDADYRDLNWQPRAATMMLMSQIKIQSSRHVKINAYLLELLLARPSIGYQRCLMLRFIQKSTVLSNPDIDVESRAMRDDASFRVCHHEDLGDILLRSILGFL
jgi:hypothetical protein